MYGLILMLHLVICLALIGVVLVQSGKGGGPPPESGFDACLPVPKT